MRENFYHVKALRRFNATVVDPDRRRKRVVKEGELVTLHKQQYDALMNNFPGYIKDVSNGKDIDTLTKAQLHSEIERLDPRTEFRKSDLKATLLDELKRLTGYVEPPAASNDDDDFIDLDAEDDDDTEDEEA